MKKRLIKSIIISLSLFGILVGYFIINKKFDIGLPCFINKTTGLFCPGCGITRMLFALLRLEIKEAFFYNPLIFIMLPFIIIYYIYFLYLYVIDNTDKFYRLFPWYSWVIVGILVISFTIARNLPYFTFLRP